MGWAIEHVQVNRFRAHPARARSQEETTLITSPESPLKPDTNEVVTPRSVEVLGVPLALVDYERTLDWIDAKVAQRSRGYICVCNVHTVMASAEDPELRSTLLGSSLNVPDGQPLVWALSALGHRLQDRVYGPADGEGLCAWRCDRPAPVSVWRAQSGGARAANAEPPPALSRRQDRRRLLAASPAPNRRGARRGGHRNQWSRADVVWVGIGVPKQEKWMAQMRNQLEAPMLIGVGAAFDFHAGLVAQAPPWMQEHGLEWAYRLAREPRRLWRRYLRYNPRFVAAFARQLAEHRRLRRGAEQHPEQGHARSSGR